MSGLNEQEQIERDIERRDSIMEPWSRIATSEGWEADADVLYWAAVDGIAWALIEASMDTSDRQPSQELHREARRTAEAILAARTEQARPEHVVKAEALREAADHFDQYDEVVVGTTDFGTQLIPVDAAQRLRDRADALEVRR